ncbi:hypothetical protein PLICRDRAFT_51063 [Plicaturopsis crispa FD-325 SS-3]|nr:hypothetical protein PLICRDRAFT_51063 [Plicaturopsis crispa FD-325 SS-3]
MAPKSRARCQICSEKESKYTCSKCMVLYCSVPCYKIHKDSSCTPSQALSSGSGSGNTLLESDTCEPPEPRETEQGGSTPLPEDRPAIDEEIPEPRPLRSLASLKWPYVPEESAYPDPLKRDDPKPLKIHQYESIATSPAIRAALASNPQLPAILSSIDRLRGPDREEALQRALGVSPPDASDRYRGRTEAFVQTDEDKKALRGLAEAVEAAVRGGKQDVLGLDWDEGE